MNINLHNVEVQYLLNLLIDRRSDALFGAPSTQELSTINDLLTLLTPSPTNIDFNPQEVGYIQDILHTQSEIWGSRRSVANEKAGTTGQNFVANRTLLLVKSISDKLGAHLKIDIDTKSDQIAPTPRAEGSTWIMTTLYPYEKQG